MSDLLKGNYKVDKEIVDVDKEKKNDFEEKAKSSIGGSMVFVEKNKMTWQGEEQKK